MSLIQKVKPSVKKRHLLFIAGLAWTTAGGILTARGAIWLSGHGHNAGWHFVAGILAGLIFYVILFAKISRKHIGRIRGLNIPYPCAFSFFNIRSYVLMTMMITGGILLRKSGVVRNDWLYTFYLAMGFPLLVSATRFFFAWFSHKELE